MLGDWVVVNYDGKQIPGEDIFNTLVVKLESSHEHFNVVT